MTVLKYLQIYSHCIICIFPQKYNETNTCVNSFSNTKINSVMKESILDLPHIEISWFYAKYFFPKETETSQTIFLTDTFSSKKKKLYEWVRLNITPKFNSGNSNTIWHLTGLEWFIGLQPIHSKSSGLRWSSNIDFNFGSGLEKFDWSIDQEFFILFTYFVSGIPEWFYFV